jgi:hypothetical protein
MGVLDMPGGWSKVKDYLDLDILTKHGLKDLLDEIFVHPRFHFSPSM